jgi:hypothetical protein
VGVMMDHFEKRFTVTKDAWIPCKEGNKTAGVNNGAHAGSSSYGSHLLHEKRVSKSPPNVGSGERFKRSGGPYSGPILADIEKSIQGAQRGSLAMKRKFRDEEPVLYDDEFLCANERSSEGVGELSQIGVVKKGRVGDVVTENIDGSRMAEAGFQPRRPQ